MAKRKKKVDPEVRRQLEESYQRTTRLLEERIAYHQAKLDEEKNRRSA